MKSINSPETFKTCYIAQVKEELGFPVRIAANRRGGKRKIQAKEELKPFIKAAIIKLFEKDQKMPTYKEIQKRAFILYQKSQRKLKSYQIYGALKLKTQKSIKDIVEDKQVFYEH